MPHQCTACERVLPGGSREMLGGCPDCGGNRFQYLPDGEQPAPGDQERDADHGTSGSPPTAADTATTDGGELIVASSGQSATPADPEPTPGPEGSAQADARSSVIDPADLPRHDTSAQSEEPVSAPDPPADPHVEELTEELQDTFGSIRIVDRGEYELNLMELYENDACIIQLEEDGRYVIDVPDMFQE